MAKKPSYGVPTRWLLACAISLAALPASAQLYTCVSSSGSAYRTSAPCPTTDNRQGLVYYGPQETYPSRGSTYQPQASRASEELRYMSAHCASMQEGIRTAGVRGIGSSTVSELRRNFQEECGDEQRRAQRKLYEEKNEKRRQQEAEQQSSQKQMAAADHAEKLRHEQCAEMRKAIAARKARPNMTEGELGDLVRFEERYANRCR